MAANTSEPVPADLDLVLLGKAGSGKSATGNSILGHKAFRTSVHGHATSPDVKSEYVELRTFRIKVIDPPDLTGTGLAELTNEQKTAEDFGQLFMACNAKVHVFVLTVRLDERLTEEERDAIMTFRESFGKMYLKQHGILVITHGDDFERVMEDQNLNLTFEEWIKKTDLGLLGDLIKECDYRCVLFDNKTKDERVKAAQLETFLNFAGELKKQGTYNKEFEEERSKKIEWMRLHKLKESYRVKISDLVNAAFKLQNEYLSEIKKIELRATDLLDEIKAAGPETSLLEFLHQVENIQKECEFVNIKINEYKSKMSPGISRKRGSKGTSKTTGECILL